MHLIREHIKLIHITGDFNLGHLATVVSTKILHCTVTVFAKFVNTRYLREKLVDYVNILFLLKL